jgi:isopentenyl-diphosphate Delta-isomerase
MEEVILVDTFDKPIGLAEKLEAHQKGYLHRAFSVFIFNNKGELLLQQRALDKYHSAGLWSNTCCSHPRAHETTLEAANRRLHEEMGMQCTLNKKFDFIYKVTTENGLIEHEFDHVLFGESNDLPTINKNEVNSWCYSTIETIERDLILDPEIFTAWFKICFNQVKKAIRNEKLQLQLTN